MAEHSIAHSRALVCPELLTEQQKTVEAPPVRQLMVRTNPVTGRKALFVGAHCARVVGWPEEEGYAFVRHLMETAIRPEFCYSHEWRVGDLIVWDNRSLLHKATPYDGARYKRLMQRTTVAGTRRPSCNSRRWRFRTARYNEGGRVGAGSHPALGNERLTDRRSRMKLIRTAAAVAVALAPFAASAQMAAPKQQFMSMATSSVGGSWFPLGGAMAKIITDAYPQLKITAEVTGGTADNLKLLKNGQVELALSTNDMAYLASRAKAPSRAARSPTSRACSAATRSSGSSTR